MEYPGKFADVLEHGHLELLRRAGPVSPRWLQSIVLYDLQWYPKADERIKSETSGLSDEALQRFYEVLHRVLEHMDSDIFLQYAATGIRTGSAWGSWPSRQALSRVRRRTW